MLIKIQEGLHSNKFIIYDNVSDVVYSDQPYYFYSSEELRKNNFSRGGEMMLLVASERAMAALLGHETDIFQEWALRFNVIHFTDGDGQSFCIVFDGNAYICTNEGKTTHKVKECPPIPSAVTAQK